MSLRQLMERYGVRPRKGLGQNFLTDPAILSELVAASSPQGLAALEVGPGLGHLTELLAGQARRVVAVELDERLVAALRDRLPAVEVVQGDILDHDPGKLVDGERYVALGNLPYYITSAVLRHLLEAEHPPLRTVVTVQREVAERLLAEPGQMSLLGVSVQFFARPQLVRRIPAGAFHPPPKVDSAAVLLHRREPPLPRDHWPRFFQLVRAGFRERRKQLHNSLAGNLSPRAAERDVREALEAAGIDPRRRAQTLSVEEWVRLYRALPEPGSSPAGGQPTGPA